MWFVLAVSFFACADLQGEDVPDFSSTRRVAQRFKVAIQYSKTTTVQNENWALDDTIPNDLVTDQKILIVGIAEVVAVENDRVKSIVLTVEQLTSTDDMDGELNIKAKRFMNKTFRLELVDGKVQIKEGTAKLAEGISSELSARLSDSLLPLFIGPASVYSKGAENQIENSWPLVVDDEFIQSLSVFGGSQFKPGELKGRVNLIGKSRLTGTSCFEIESTAVAKTASLLNERGDFPEKVTHEVTEKCRFLVPVDSDTSFFRSRRVRQSTLKSIHTAKPLAGYETTISHRENTQTYISPIEPE